MYLLVLRILGVEIGACLCPDLVLMFLCTIWRRRVEMDLQQPQRIRQQISEKETLFVCKTVKDIGNAKDGKATIFICLLAICNIIGAFSPFPMLENGSNLTQE